MQIQHLALLGALLVTPASSARHHPAHVNNRHATYPPTPISYYCTTDAPDEECGYLYFDAPCEEIVESYQWLSGNCCSLSDVDYGQRCLLTVDGPGSYCDFKEKDRESYLQYHISLNNSNTCPPSKYGIPYQGVRALASAPDPATADSESSMAEAKSAPVSGICITETPDESCGLYYYNIPCSKVISQYRWTGTCCSFIDTDDGGCSLITDGPGSECTWTNRNTGSSFTVVISTDNQKSCPQSDYQVLDVPVTSQLKICMSAAYSECAQNAGCNKQRFPSFRQAYDKCEEVSEKKAIQCVNQATDTCDHAPGTPPLVACEHLSSMHETGFLKYETCGLLKSKCGNKATLASCD